VSVEQVREARAGGRPLPPDGVLVTFDDGYLDNFENALPILKRHRIPALFFIATRYVTERRPFWWEAVAFLVRRCAGPTLRIEYPQVESFDLTSAAARSAATRRLCQIVKDHYGLDLDRFLDAVAAGAGVPLDQTVKETLGDRTLMRWEQVKALRAAGMGIGSHTHGHRGIATLPLAELATDLATSRSILESEIGESITTIAYPFGHSVESAPMVRKTVDDAGFEIGFQIAPGINQVGPAHDSLDTRRLTVDRVLPRGLARTWMAFPFLAS
jgi:peptidoglycan/xylan/chitin deacetylase (PgdA/CDA1 family)